MLGKNFVFILFYFLAMVGDSEHYILDIVFLLVRSVRQYLLHAHLLCRANHIGILFLFYLVGSYTLYSAAVR